MKKILNIFIGLCFTTSVVGQGLHFSQFYNNPVFINPANTGQLQDADYRVGLIYRTQYTNIPVPYNTVGASAEFGLMRNNLENNWFGVGISVWNDKSGDGNLSLTKTQANAGYHILAGDKSLLSLGVGIANVARNVNISALTFVSQWDDLSFNPALPNQEKAPSGNMSYLDIHFGGNFLYTPNDQTSISIGASVQHINQPKETFLGTTNRIGMRPILNAEATFKTSDNFILQPSAYYTYQKRASELVFGTMTNTNLSRGNGLYNSDKNELLNGIYYRMGDAIIFCTGYKWNNFSLMMSYDHTLSSLAVANRGFGAFEVSLTYNGKYGNFNEARPTYGCPRF
jgi:type IX secretion system PorP/SprF family membrane protein